ncbi:MAG: hypothetical protein ACE5K4_04550 [Candidatus Hydrothermarchaeota archaeon]
MEVICSGCSCLCDDIEIKGTVFWNACRKGTGRLKPVEGETDVKKINEAIDLLNSSKKIGIYGGANLSNEGIKILFDLAENLGAIFWNRDLIQRNLFLKAYEEWEIAKLDEIKDYGRFIMCWGSDNMNTHPRLLSRYIYFTHGEKTPKGYEDRILVPIDIELTPTAVISLPYYVKLKKGTISEIEKADKKETKLVKHALEKAEHRYIIIGERIIEEEDELDRFIKEYEMKVLPLAHGFNHYSLFEELLKRTKNISPYDFENKEIAKEYKVDVLLIVGGNPFAKVPDSQEWAEKIITLDPFRSYTALKSEVWIKSALNGVCVSTNAKRMDGEDVSIEALYQGKLLSDEEILRSILEGTT